MNEETTVKPWNPEDAINQLKDRIRLEFAQLVPDAQWQVMVKNAVHSFLCRHKDQYGREEEPLFNAYVNQVLRQKISEQLDQVFASAEWKEEWDSSAGGNMPSKMAKEIIEKRAPEIMVALMSQMLSNFMSNQFLQLKNTR